MLSLRGLSALSSEAWVSCLFISAIVIGSLLGYFTPAVSDWLSHSIDYTLLILVSLLFFGVRFDALFQAVGQLDFLVIAVLANFLVIPLLGYGMASLFLSDHPMFFVGLIIYFMAPCTDWFLSFTRLSKGNVALGTALIPINMALQLLLYPLYLQWFTQSSVQIEATTIGDTLLQWFLLPLVLAVIAHQLLSRLLSTAQFQRILSVADHAAMWMTALLVLQIFATHISVTIAHFSVLVWVLIAVFCFFVITFFLAEALSYVFKLRYPEKALLSMTMASRNAPLMLAITMVTLPEQPLIYAALVIGMLIEIPHLTLLRYLLLSTRQRHSSKVALSTEAEHV